jgi:hypothetical protein
MPLAGNSPRVAIGDVPESEWPKLISLASANLALSHLATTVAEVLRGGASPLPHDVADYFSAVLHLGETRAKAVREQLGDIVLALNRAGVTPLLLKGAAYELLGLYARAGTRLFTDLDLLVPLDQISRAASALTELGYRADSGANVALGEHHHHLPGMTKEGALAAIELHREPLRWQAQGLLPGDQLLADARRVPVAGRGEVLIPSPTHLVFHNILHSQVSSYRHWKGDFMLKDAIDLVALERRFAGSIDWPRIVAKLNRSGLDGVAGFYVPISFEIFGMSPPPSIRSSRRARLARAVWAARQRGETHHLMPLMQFDLVLTVARRAIAERSVLAHLRSWLDLAFRRAGEGRATTK